MKKLIYLIVLALILGLVLTGCLLSNVGQVPTTEQSGVTYLTKALPPPEHLVGLWHFDEGIGTTANDSSVNNNNGILHNFSDTYWVADQWGGYALSFDGMNDYVDIYDSSGSLDITGPITVEAWVKFNSAAMGKDSVIARKWNAYSLQKYTDDKLEGWVKIGGTWYGVRGITGGAALTSDTWYHLAFTYDNANVRTYVNGSLDRIGTVAGYIDTTTGNASIGTDLEGHGAYTAGIIDEVRIWKVALALNQLGFYGFNGFLPPVSLGKPFKFGRTIPIKFQLTDAQGAFITNAVPLISLELLSNGPLTGDVIDGESSGAANTDNIFRYDPDSNQYIFNLATNNLTAPATYRITVALGDGTTQEVDISLK